MHRGLLIIASSLAITVQAENEALQQLVLEVAQNKQEAQRRVAGLKHKYGNLLAKVQLAFPLSGPTPHSSRACQLHCHVHTQDWRLSATELVFRLTSFCRAFATCCVDCWFRQ